MAPQRRRDCQWVNLALLPPTCLVACGMVLGVMNGAERNREFITHFEAQTSGLRVANMVSLRWRSATDKARLARNEPQMSF